MATLDSRRGDVAVVVAAGGAGQRLGGGMPKALRRLAGETLLAHAVRRVIAASSVGWIVVASPPGYESTVRELLSSTLGEGRTAGSGWPGRILVVAGGADRQGSVAAALSAVPDEFGVVLVHDAARALAPGSLVEDVAAAVRAGQDAVVPVLKVTDTISQVDPTGQVISSPDRSALRAVQTPQGFRHAVLAAAHAAAQDSPDPAAPAVTDDAGLVARLGVPVHTVPGSAYAMKITTAHDLAVAEALLATCPPDPP